MFKFSLLNFNVIKPYSIWIHFDWLWLMLMFLLKKCIYYLVFCLCMLLEISHETKHGASRFEKLCRACVLCMLWYVSTVNKTLFIYLFIAVLSEWATPSEPSSFIFKSSRWYWEYWRHQSQILLNRFSNEHFRYFKTWILCANELNNLIESHVK